MARKKGMNKRPRAGGELAARATALLDEVWAEHVEAEAQRDLGRVKRTIWASAAEYAAIRAYLAPPRAAAGGAPAGQPLRGGAARRAGGGARRSGGGLGAASGAAAGPARAVA